MNVIELLKKRIGDLKSLIEKETVEEESQRLTAELMDCVKQLGAEETKAEIAEETKAKLAEDAKADRAEAKKHTKLATVPVDDPTIEVGAPGLYKGFKLRAEVDAAINGYNEYRNVNKAIRKRIKDNPERAEKMVKFFIDLLERSISVRGFGQAKAAMQEGTDSEGGYLTPTEERMELLAYVRESSIALQECALVNMVSDVQTLPAENAKVSVAYTAEESAATETEPTISQVTLTAKRMDGWSKVSNELLQDSTVPGGIIGILMSQFTEAVGLKVDSTVFMGTGDPVSGVYLSAGDSEVFASGSTHFSELLESNIRNIITDVQPERRRNAKFIMHDSVLWAYVHGLKDSNGNYMFHESRGGAAEPHRLWGYPVRESSQTKSTSAADTALMIFGDLQGFMIGERLSRIDLFVDPYTAAANYQTKFFLFTRWAYAHALSAYYSRMVTAAS